MNKIKRLVIIGVGLIGGSLALALKKKNLVEEVIGCGRNLDNLETAKKLGIIDHFTTDPTEAVTDADIIFLAIPLGSIRDILSQIKPHISSKTIITDGGSAKQQVIDDCLAVFGEFPTFFVPAHPIAGTENSGATAAFDSLYQNRRLIITPHQNTAQTAIETITKMWQACGSEVVQMPAQHHDQILAATSHLPHLLAFGLVDTLASMNENSEIFHYAAGGFRDFTRIASSNPLMWRDICVANKEAISHVMEHFIDEMQQLADLVKAGDSEQIEAIFVHAKKARDNFIDS